MASIRTQARRRANAQSNSRLLRRVLLPVLTHDMGDLLDSLPYSDELLSAPLIQPLPCGGLPSLRIPAMPEG